MYTAVGAFTTCTDMLSHRFLGGRRGRVTASMSGVRVVGRVAHCHATLRLVATSQLESGGCRSPPARGPAVPQQLLTNCESGDEDRGFVFETELTRGDRVSRFGIELKAVLLSPSPYDSRAALDS